MQINVGKMTDNQPFCAGVAFIRDGKIMLTLNSDGLPEGMQSRCFRIGGVGGGQERGETIVECAVREAAEELSLAAERIELMDSAETYFHDMDTGSVSKIDCDDPLRPFLLERITNPTPDVPYKPGLPTGPYIYFAIYLGAALAELPAPGDDVEGLLNVPMDRWTFLDNEPTIEELIGHQFEYIGSQAHLGRKVWIPERESFVLVCKLMQDQGITEQ